MQRDEVIPPTAPLPVLGLDAPELRRHAPDRLLPGRLAPRVGDLLPHHRRQDPLGMRGIAVGEAPLDAGMPAVGLAVLPRHHPHHLLAAHLGLEGAADPAVGAGGDLRMLGDADLVERLLGQRARRAGLHAGPAGHALRGDDTPRSSRRPSGSRSRAPRRSARRCPAPRRRRARSGSRRCTSPDRRRNTDCSRPSPCGAGSTHRSIPPRHGSPPARSAPRSSPTAAATSRISDTALAGSVSPWSGWSEA